VKRRLVEEFPDGSTWEFYGSTEGQFTACRSEEWLERPGTLGHVRRGRTMFADEDGHLWCVVPPHARFSYFGDPDKFITAMGTESVKVIAAEETGFYTSPPIQTLFTVHSVG
jgi:long-chain acyl-CoA synthetase